MALTDEQLNELNRTLPLDPGVYLMSDARKKVIYVGKAKNLKKRVSTYFQTSRAVGPKLRALVKNVAQVDWLVTGSEKEALILGSDPDQASSAPLQRHPPGRQVLPPAPVVHRGDLAPVEPGPPPQKRRGPLLRALCLGQIGPGDNAPDQPALPPAQVPGPGAAAEVPAVSLSPDGPMPRPLLAWRSRPRTTPSRSTR